MGKCGENQCNYQQQSGNRTKVGRKPIKIKYISSPLIVKASNAVEFRAIVQQLTGLNSDATICERIDTEAFSSRRVVIGRRAPSSTLLPEEMDVKKFPDDMSSFFELHESCSGRENLHKSFMGFPSPCLFQ